MNLLLGIISFLIIDFIYLSSISNYFGKQISSIQGEKMEVKMVAAAVVYALIVIQWYYFIYKKINRNNMKEML